jgi:soluble cytochrome b562
MRETGINSAEENLAEHVEGRISDKIDTDSDKFTEEEMKEYLAGLEVKNNEKDREQKSLVEGTVEGTKKVINGFDTTVHAGKQGKHIEGHNNYIDGKSIMNGNMDDIQKLVDEFAGTGQWKTDNKEMVDFGKTIGDYVDINTGEALKTTRGIIHYSKKGVHIVPAKPIP